MGKLDYSSELSELVVKIRAVGVLLRDSQEHEDTTKNLLTGAGLILDDLSEQLDTIKCELYPE